MLRLGLFCSAALLCAAGCAYPRRTTPLSDVTQGQIDRATQPKDLWQVQLVSAEIPNEKRDGMSWDENGGAPDVYVVLLQKDKLLWKSPVLKDSSGSAKFEAEAAPNLTFDRNARIGLQLWDEDSVGADPIGVYQGKLLSDAVIDAPILVKLDSGASLTLRLLPPKPKLGSGIAEYEIRPNSLYIITVLPNSPAARAGLERGDRITAIGGKVVKTMKREEAASALTLAAQNETELTVQRDKTSRPVKLDKGYVWAASD